MKADRVLFEADPNARRGYELRAAQSEPGLEPADEHKQLTAVGGQQRSANPRCTRAAACIASPPMHSLSFRAAVVAALLIAWLAPASADAAKKTDWLYDVTVRAELTQKWSFHEEAHMGDAVEPCDSVQDAAGTARIQLRTRRPTRVMVMRGTNGQPPMLDVGTGEGVPLTGTVQARRQGRGRGTRGPKCGPANPPLDPAGRAAAACAR